MKNKMVTNLPCGHSLHLRCFKKLQHSHMPTKRKCPMCRATYETTPEYNTPGTLDEYLVNILRAADDRELMEVLSNANVEFVLNQNGVDTHTL